MARSCGIRLGARGFEAVVLDGGPKKHKVVATVSGELSSDPLEDPAAVGAALRGALKGVPIPRENVGVAMDARHAAFRKLKLPFAERAKIEQVIKYEVEGELPQFDIDQVVVDFLVLAQGPEGVQVLATAVPKAEVRRVIDVLNGAGLEPLEVELETTAMVNAATAADVCRLDNAVVLVHVGEESTSVVTVDGGRVSEMRVIHLGAASHEPRREEAPAAEVEGEEAPAGPQANPAELQRRLEQVLQRIRRELSRTVSGARTEHDLESVQVCGSDLPGLVGGDVMGVPVERLSVLGEAVSEGARERGHVVAYGTALRQLGGGVLSPSLRREELRYTGAFERLELPLAVAALLLVTWLGVSNIFTFKEVQRYQRSLANWWTSSNNFMLTDIQGGSKGYLEFPPERLERYVRDVEAVTGTSGFGEYEGEESRLDSLAQVKAQLTSDIREMKKKLGRDTELKHPQSAFKGMALVLDLIEAQGESIGRFAIRSVEARQQKESTRESEHVRVTMDLVFFADSPSEATRNYEGLLQAFDAAPWGMRVEPAQNQPLDDGKGIFLQGINFLVDTTQADSEEVWS